MRHRSRLIALGFSLMAVLLVGIGESPPLEAATAEVTLPDGKSYEVKLKNGMPTQFRSREVEVLDLALQAKVALESDDPLPFNWVIFANVLAEGSFVVTASTPFDPSATASFEFTGPGKLVQPLFECVRFPRACADLDRPGTHWFLAHLSFERKGGGKGFEVDQWARTDQLELEQLRSMVAGAKAKQGGTPAPEPAPNPRATLFVFRARGFVGCGVKLPVTCDGEPVARINCGRYFMMEFEPGHHSCESDPPNSRIPLVLEAGRKYFLRVDAVAPEMIGRARGVLSAVKAEEGTQAVLSLVPLDRENVLDPTKVVGQ